MSYIGNSPALKYASFAVQHFTTSATTSYSLDNSVANENDIALFVNNVRQQPGGSYAYTAAGTTLTLSAATTSSDTMYCVFIGKAVQTVTPPVNSVGTSQLVADSVTTAKILDDNVTTAKILDTNVTGAKLNDDVISGQGALGAAPADTDEFLVSDAGVLKRVDYSYIKGITQTSFLPTAAPLIINGDMAVAQRGTSKTSISTGVHGYWTCDRFRERNDTGGTWTQTQESLTSGDALADGFANSLKMDNTTANASLSATSRLYLNYAFEGQDVQVFKKGTANAEKYTVSFWVKATKTGTNILELWDNGGTTRHCCTAYTISSTDTWEKKVVNFPADTTGVIADGSSDNFIMYFWLAAGTNYTSGTLATTWANTTAANSAVGQVNNADSTSNNFEITGVQLEVGEYTSSDLPPFRFESFADNLQRCSRYYQRAQAASDAYKHFGLYFCAVDSGGTSYGTAAIPLVTTMRAIPTLGTTGTVSNYEVVSANTGRACTTLSVDTGIDDGTINGLFYINAYTGTGITGGIAGALRAGNTADAFIALDSEL